MTLQKKHGDAVGGAYLAVHWRRKDFVRSHAKQIPSIEGAAKQIETALNTLQLTTVFIATDAPDDGWLYVDRRLKVIERF